MGRFSKSKSFALWTLAVIITLSSVVYQRITGPTRPVRGKVEIRGEIVKYKLLRTHDISADAVMTILVPDTSVSAVFQWKRFKSYDQWTIDTLRVSDNKITIIVPKQPPAGKVIYDVTLFDGNGGIYPLSEEAITIRFKGVVPLIVLLPHVLFMFIAMLIGTRTGIEAIAKGEKAYRYALITTVLLFLGGLIFGPLVQKFAFDAYWTGWPFGHDLTDNKTLISFIFWLIALWQGKKPGRGRTWFIIASVVQLLIYLVPHSVLGSEIDYTAMNQ
ncbi:hypothetical protein B6I21_08395 [candidate division KSB1 bacterium 4572_119]|nr:MAG: hypothetical protein B6I21_08395 [candidate division KSB1 bacterium 4572_119]